MDTCRPHPLLHGSPTTIHSFSRKASALAVRLGCPLIQIVCILLALESNRRHAVKADRPGLCIYTLCKARAMWMGHTYFGAVTHQVSNTRACTPALDPAGITVEAVLGPLTDGHVTNHTRLGLARVLPSSAPMRLHLHQLSTHIT
jgi:hypothetical protein